MTIPILADRTAAGQGKGNPPDRRHILRSWRWGWTIGTILAVAMLVMTSSFPQIQGNLRFVIEITWIRSSKAPFYR